MSYEKEQDIQSCGCGSECDCHNVTDDVAVQEEQPKQVEEVETTQGCGCGCGCH